MSNNTTTSIFDFNKLKEAIGENTHTSKVFNLPNTVTLKFRNGESDTLSNNNLVRIGEITSHSLKLVMVPNDQVEETEEFINSCNDSFFEKISSKLAETKPVKGSTVTNPSVKLGKEIISKFMTGSFVTAITLTEAQTTPEIGEVVIDSEGNTNNVFINELIKKEEEAKAKKIEALAKAREAKKLAEERPVEVEEA